MNHNLIGSVDSPKSAEAHSSLALIRGLYDWQWQEAEVLYLRAIELNPGYSTAHHWLGIDCYALLGRLDEAAAELEIARQLDPLSSILREGLAFLKLLAHDYEAAIAGYKELIKDDPTFYKGYTALGRAYAQQGNYLDALRLLDRFPQPDWSVADYRVARFLLQEGIGAAQAADVLQQGSPGFPRSHPQPEDYLRRTVQAADASLHRRPGFSRAPATWRRG